MPVRIAIVGPGRVGCSLARGFAAAGAVVVGFVGRDPVRTAAAVASCGIGRVLSWPEATRAHALVFAVGDQDLPGAIAAAAATPVRACSLWLHTSGRHDLDVFAGIAGIRCGSLHPVAPFSGRSGELVGKDAVAVIAGDGRALPLLRRLCALLGMPVVVAAPGDRALYHAACALAANGLTALWALAEAAMVRSRVVDPGAARLLTGSLLRQAAAACQAQGPSAALSGPVRRGDAATVALHLDRLAGSAAAADAYRALALGALDLAAQAGLAPALVARVAAVLRQSE